MTNLVNMKPWSSSEVGARLIELMRTDGPHAELRRHILEVATDHFVRFGYRRANVGDIARDAGIGKGSVYLHFDSKQTLLVAAIAAEKMQLVPGFQRVMALPPPQQLEAHIRLSLEFVLGAPLTSRLVRGDAEFERVLRSMDSDMADDRERGRSTIAAIVAGCAPGLSEAQRGQLADLLGAVLVLPAHLDATPSLMQLDRETFIDLYTRILTRGIQALDE